MKRLTLMMTLALAPMLMACVSTGRHHREVKAARAAAFIECDQQTQDARIRTMKVYSECCALELKEAREASWQEGRAVGIREGYADAERNLEPKLLKQYRKPAVGK